MPLPRASPFPRTDRDIASRTVRTSCAWRTGRITTQATQRIASVLSSGLLAYTCQDKGRS
jgi:hypothetical protein